MTTAWAWSTCSRRVHAHRASDHSCEWLDLRRLQSLHWLLTRRWRISVERARSLLQRLHLHFRPAKRRKNVRVIARSKACCSP